jgi:uncharacterized protein GlcG (DUF336 family)
MRAGRIDQESTYVKSIRIRSIAAPCGAAALAALAALSAPPAVAADALVTVRQLAPETATRAAQAALLHCRGRGYSVGVAVVDRSGVAQVFLRDRFGGAHTVDAALNKAWTAASFRMSTTELAAETQAGRPMSAIRQIARVAALGGGLPIEAAGAVVGAIGVSGAPGGDADEDCAKAGIRAIQADIEL